MTLCSDITKADTKVATNIINMELQPEATYLVPQTMQ